MIEHNQAVALWNRCLSFIKDNVNATAFKTWFEPIVPLKYEATEKALTIGVPSPFFYEYLEEKYVGLLRAAIYKEIGEGTELMYSILTDKTNHITVNIEGTKRSSALPEQAPVYNGNKTPNPLQAPAPQDLDPHLNPNYNFENFIKGNSDWLTSVGDCGITADDYANQYQYNLDLGTVSGEDSYDANNVKALFWQATPGCFQLRADLCEKYLGTTDPAELSTMFSTWDGILEAARKVNDASSGKCKLFSGYDECFRVLSNSRATGWYGDDDVITVDDNMTEYMDLAKTMVDEGLTYETDQWSTDWYANMEGDGETSNAAVAYCGCPWFTYWSLKDTWKGNTILVNAPEQFYWGGTGLAATVNCADKEMAGTIIKAFTCDTDFMVSINAKNSDFVNNKEAVKKISEAGATCDFLYADAGQDIMAFYLPMADSISAKNATAEDQNINASWATQVKEYAAGNKDKDTAIADFKSAVHDSYSYLKAE